MMRCALREHVSCHLKIVYDPPSEADRQKVDAVFQVLYDFLVLRLEHKPRDEQGSKRILAWRRLKSFFAGPLTTLEIRHFCPPGCHATPESAMASLCQDWGTLFIDHPPPVIAINKWGKIAPPMLWFAAFTSIHRFVADILGRIVSRTYEQQQVEFEEDDLTGQDTQRAFLRQEAVRMKKVQAMVTAKDAPQKLMATAITVKTSLNILGAGFEASRWSAGVTTSLLDFIHESKSPPMHTITFCCQVLQDEGNPFWMPLLGWETWHEQLYITASVPQWTLIGELFSRFVVLLRQWPWKLGNLLGDEYTRALKDDLADELLDACVHMDPFTKGYRQPLRTRDDVLREDNIQFLGDVFSQVPVSNCISELSFAASHVRRSTSHGNEAAPSTIASNHVLTMAKSKLDSTVSLQRKVSTIPPPPATKQPRCAYRNFVKGARSAGTPLAEAARQWKGMTPAQRAEYNVDNVVVSSLPPPEAPPVQPVTPPWPGCGDAFYPISAECLSDFPAQVSALSAEWKRRISPTVLVPAQKFDAPIVETCEECWGRRRCCDEMKEDVKAKMTILKKRLHRWSAITRSATTCDRVWSTLPLLYIGWHPDNGGAGAAAAAPLGKAALMICKKVRSQVFCVQTCPPPMPGDVIRFAPTKDSLKGFVDFASLWQVEDDVGAVALRISYKVVGLVAFEVLSVTSMADAEAAFAKERAQETAASRLSTLVKDFDKTLPVRVARHAGCGKRKATVAEHSPLAVPAPGEEQDHLGMLDVDIAGEADAELAMENEDLEAYAGMPADDVDGMADGLAAWDAVARHDPAEVFGVGAESDRSDGEEEPRLPILDNGQVRNPENLAEIWGRLSITKEGTPQECVAAYCRRHGCSIMKRTRTAPSTQQFLRWFALGQNLPPGRAAALQDRHKRLLMDA